MIRPLISHTGLTPSRLNDFSYSGGLWSLSCEERDVKTPLLFLGEMDEEDEFERGYAE